VSTISNDDKNLCDLHELRLDQLEEHNGEMQDKQQKILETLNNGLKSTTKENSDKMEKLTDRFNQFLWGLVLSMTTVTGFLVTIIWQLSQLGE